LRRLFLICVLFAFFAFLCVCRFVNFTSLVQNYRDPQQRAVQFALEALMELPEQYKIIKQKGMLNSRVDPSVRFASRMTGKHVFRRSFVPNSGRSGGGIGVEGVQLGGMDGGGGGGGLAPGGPPGGRAPSPNPPPYAPRY
jgi:uncharacterized membrane protein YgcG